MKCFENYELKKHTTFKIGGSARRVFFPQDVEEFCTLLKDLTIKDNSPLVLGGGSNVLVSSYGVDSDVILTTEMKSFEFCENFVTAQCGVRVPLLSKSAQKEGLSGFEFMVGFPGSVGGIVYMNASAHKQFVSDTCFEALVFDAEKKKVITLNKEDLNFCYRRSILCEKNYILLEAKFELTPADPEEINKKMQNNIDFRKDKQPSLAFPNAGSVFKNPEGDSAGRLLEIAGAKGMKEGGAVVWNGHANFILNEDNATSKDVSHLMNRMYNMVKEKCAVELEPEVLYIGGKNEEEAKLWNTMLKK